MAPYANPWYVPLLKHWNPPTKTQGRPLTLHIHRALLSSAQVALLFCHDNVLYVLHGQVLAEGVIEKSLQLIHCQLLHVTLGWVAKGTSVLATTLPQAHPAQSQRHNPKGRPPDSVTLKHLLHSFRWSPGLQEAGHPVDSGHPPLAVV